MSHPISVTTIGTCLLLGVAGSFGIPSTAHAATRTVTNCNDSGTGSLRQRAAIALSGDTIDLRGLSCHLITLTSGPITLPQQDIHVRGPGYRALIISGNYRDSVFRHVGTGTLWLSGVTVEKGNRQAQVAEGGCIFSAGDFNGYDLEIRRCGAHGLGTGQTNGAGGGVAAARHLVLTYSGVHNNTARGFNSHGGGLAAGENMTLKRVRVTGNSAREGGGVSVTGGFGTLLSMDTVTISGNSAATGGAVKTQSPVYIVDSTLSGNVASVEAGAFVFDYPFDKLIVNSTISGNRAPRFSAGAANFQITIVNSTVAFNDNRPGTALVPDCSQAFGALGSQTMELESTIVARNTCNGAAARDIAGIPDWRDPVIGSNNLVMSADRPLPADTLSSDPRLAPLANNGGRTQTHALLQTSPAIDQGNNTSGSDYDQRGPGFPRVKGNAPDIGAFER